MKQKESEKLLARDKAGSLISEQESRVFPLVEVRNEDKRSLLQVKANRIPNRRMPNGTYGWCERTASELISCLLLDFLTPMNPFCEQTARGGWLTA